METPCIIPYAPRPLQWRFHQQRTRFCVLLCHRRFGKTVAAVNDLLRAALRTSRTDWRAAYAAPYLGQAKAVAWDYLRHFAGVIPGTRFHEGELRCDLPNGARIRLYGTDNAQALRGLYLDDLVLDEPADIPREVWSQILRPALADRQGRALFCGTPKGCDNLLHDVWQLAGSLGAAEGWSRFRFPASQTGYLPQAELDDFTFDKSYSDKIKDRIAQTEQAVKKQLAARDAAAIEQERKFTELFNKGLESFGRKAWQAAIDSWTLAQNMKPGNKEVKQKIAEAQEQAKLEEARKSVEPQNEQTYRLLLAAADSLFSREEYPAAKEKYASAKQIKTKEPYPQEQIRNIDRLLAEIAQKEAITQQQLAEAEATYQKTIAQADRSYQAQEYRQAITTYRQALALKSEEAYPRNMIGKAEQALAALEKQQADEAEKQRQEEERINALKLKYTGIIAEADQAFKNENYSAAKLRYTEADQLNLGEDYPRKRLGEIEQIIHSSKYKARLAEYNKNKTLAEKNLEQKNYASAKVYFQKALTLSPADKESIRERIAETDRLIEAEQLAALDKAYQTNIDKADKAYAEKAYAIAKFYYQKALEIKIGDKHATERLQEIEKYIGERQTKEAEL